MEALRFPGRTGHTTGEIGSAKDLYLGRLHKITSRIDPRSRKTLALVVALVLTVVSFFAAREAQAQQPAQESSPKEASQQRVVVVTDGEVARSVGDKPPPNETLPADKPARPPVDSVPPAPKTPEPALQPAPQQFAVVIVNGEVTESDPASPWPTADPEPAPPGGDVGSTPEPSPYTWAAPDAEAVLPPAAPKPEPVLEPVASEQPTPPAYEPVQWSAGQQPIASQGDASVSPPAKEAPRVFEEVPAAAMLASPLLGKGVAPAAPVKNESAYAAPIAPLPSPATGRKPSVVPSVPVPMQRAATHPSSSLGATVSVVSSAVENIRSAAASATSFAAEVLGTLAGGSVEHSSDGTQEGLSESAPQPAPPLAPPMGGSSFSLPGVGGGQAGSSGSVAPLLVGVLASVLVLLRRDVRTWLVSCELPKPSSALLLPLERPG